MDDPIVEDPGRWAMVETTDAARHGHLLMRLRTEL
jgi:hypothetical protein